MDVVYITLIIAGFILYCELIFFGVVLKRRKTYLRWSEGHKFRCVFTILKKNGGVEEVVLFSKHRHKMVFKALDCCEDLKKTEDPLTYCSKGNDVVIDCTEIRRIEMECLPLRENVHPKFGFEIVVKVDKKESD